MGAITEKPGSSTSLPTLTDLSTPVKESIGRALGKISGKGGVQLDAEEVARGLTGELSPAVSQVAGRCLAQIAECFESAKSGVALAQQLEKLEKDYKVRLASAGEDLSRRNREVEREVRNVLAILENATHGVDPEKSALCLEVYRLSAKSLLDDSEQWEKFKDFLRDRQKNQLKCDVGYNAVILPIEVGDPSAGKKAQENIAEFLDRIMTLGAELGVMFFVDVHSAGKSIFEESTSPPPRTALAQELTQVLEELSWKEDGNHLGALLKARAGGQKKSQYLVLCGGLSLLASRRNDPDFSLGTAPSDDVILPTSLVVSPGAIAAGLLAFTAADDNSVIGLPSGENPGKGATIAKLATPPSDRHHELAREAGVNIPYLMSTAGMPTFDTSKSVQGADPSFQKQGRGSIEAVVMEQLIRRLLRRYLRRLPSNMNNQEGRYKYVTSPLKKILDGLQRIQKLRSFEVNDETTSDMEMRSELKINVSYVEMAKVDRARIVVERSATWQGDPENPQET